MELDGMETDIEREIEKEKEIERGYLYSLMGALLIALVSLPFNLNIILYFGLIFLGYLLIAMGIREMRMSSEGLKVPYFFVIAMLILRVVHVVAFLSRSNLSLQFFWNLFILDNFLIINIFFWLFKEEDTWLSSIAKLLECLVYGVVSIIFAMSYVLIVFPPTRNIPFIPWFVIVDRYEIFILFRFLHYIVLTFILLKRYLVARKNVTGPKRWD